MIKSKETIAKMKELAKGVVVLENVLSDGEIKHLKSWYETLAKDDRNNRSRASNALTGRKNSITRIPPDQWPEFSEMITPRLGLQDFIYENIQFYTTQNTYHLHSDTGKDDAIGFVQGVIPIDIQPSNIDTYTIIFDQTVHFSSEWIHPSFNKGRYYEPFVNIATRDPSIYEGWSDEYKIDDQTGRMLWYDQWPFWKEAYKGFSIKHLFKWRIGDILMFDRTFLHAASLIDKAGIQHKSGVLFLTEHIPGMMGI